MTSWTALKFSSSLKRNKGWLRASVVGLLYAKCKVHLAFRPKNCSAMGRQNFFEIQLQYHLKCKMVLQLNGIKKIFLMLEVLFNSRILSPPSFLLLFSLSSFSLSHLLHAQFRPKTLPNAPLSPISQKLLSLR